MQPYNRGIRHSDYSRGELRVGDRYHYGTVHLETSLKAGFIDASIEADGELVPRFVSNDKAARTTLLSVIKRQLSECISFDFSVAFIAEGGLQTLMASLNELAERNIPGRIITSTYLNFNSPDSFRALLRFPNIETRVYQGNMHAKGYFFNKEDINTIIVGSSNLTQTALTCNKEWNVLLHACEDGDLLRSARSEFDELWASRLTAPLTASWISAYERERSMSAPSTRKAVRAFVAGSASPSPGVDEEEVRPNEMQRKALLSLAEIHREREPRALLISATGTGKTYLSAFDVAATKPKRVLFVAHRARILDASLESYRKVLKGAYTYELFGAGSTIPTATCVFAMAPSLVRHLDQFDSKTFDYIVIDEAHRAGASSYQKILDHFKPSFCLGMTATPSRTDGYDVFKLFNHVIAFRITLQDALESDMLAPFHYFGVADLEIDDETADDPALFSRLTCDERVRHIASKINELSVNTSRRRGLIFCSRNDEAREISRQLNKLGFRTMALSGSDSDEVRNNAISKLERNELEYILTVDIFNEGIDIPSLNQIIMLRRTESPIVFVQQLGRGLRKSEGKEFTLVLDFIGNYQCNFFVPIALSGDRTYNKDNLRAFMKEGTALLPGCTTISFDRIAEQRIFRALDQGRFSSARLLRDEYTNLKNIIGRIPRLSDFDKHEAIDPLLIFSKYGSYHEFLLRNEPDYNIALSDSACKILKFLSQRLASGKRAEELLILRKILESGEKSILVKSISKEGEAAACISKAAAASAMRYLSGSFSASNPEIIVEENGKVFLSPSFAAALSNDGFAKHVWDILDFGLSRNAEFYCNHYKDTGFVLYSKYTYEEACRILNWEKDVNGQNIGGYKYDEKTNTFPVFINYEKEPGIDDTI